MKVKKALVGTSGRRRLLWYVLAVVVVLVIFAIALFVKSRTFTDTQYEATLKHASSQVTDGNINAAKSDVAKLKKHGGENDYRVYAVEADIAFKAKDLKQVKLLAEKSLKLFNSASENKKDDAIATRMNGYVTGLYQASPSQNNKNYTVPKEKINDPDFQG